MLKQNAKTLHIKEQYIDDPVSNLTLYFRVTPSGDYHLQIEGDNLPFGNRDLFFNEEGEFGGGGTGLRQICTFLEDN